MSSELEAWNAKEKLRSDIGWAPVILGLGGAVCILVGVLAGLGVSKGTVKVFGAALGPAAATTVSILFGIALLACARGLWHARPWARWAVLALFGIQIVQSVIACVRDGAIALPVLALWVVVYLLLPSTARTFRRAQG